MAATHRRGSIWARRVIGAMLLLLACSCASAASEEFAPSAAAAAAAAPFVLPARPTRPAAGALQHTPVAVPVEGEEDEAETAGVASAANGRSAARSVPSGSASARSAAATTGSAPAPAARRARHTPRRFQHSGIVAPSGQTVSPQEAAQQVQRQEAARNRRRRRRTAAAHKKKRAAAAHQTKAARESAEAGHAGAETAQLSTDSSTPNAADAETDTDADVDSADSAADAADSLPAANFTLPFDDPPTLQSRAAALAHAGFSVLHYDVTLSAAARNMDDDLNVLQVQCARRAPTAAAPNATLALRLVVVDADAAMDEYTPGAVLHGSSMWGCGDAEAGTVMGRVDNATRVDDHSVSLLLSHAGYEQLFDKAEIIFQQPKEEEEEQEEEDEEMEGQTAAEAQPSDASASTPTPAGRSSRRRVMALPPSTGSMPFEFPQTHAAVSAAPSHASPADRAFRPMASGDFTTQLVLPSGLLTVNSAVTINFWPQLGVLNNKLTVWLRRYDPTSLSDTDAFGGWIYTLSSGSCIVNKMCSIHIDLSDWLEKSTPIEPSVWGYYFKLQFNEDGWCTSCTEDAETDQFWVPITKGGSVIGDGQGNAAVQAYSRSCDDLDCDDSDKSTLDGVMCGVCSPTRKVSVKLECDGCAMEYRTALSQVYLKYRITGYLHTEVVADARVVVQLAVSAGVELSVKAKHQFSLLRDIQIPLPWTGITVGGYTLGLVASLSLDGQADLDFQGSATISARTTVTAHMQGRLSYDSDAEEQSAGSQITPVVEVVQPPIVTVNAAAQVSVEIMLRPKIHVGISYIAHANLSADAFVRVDGSFQYPPFPALPKPYQLPAPFPDSWGHYGPCDTAHMVRYSVTAGVRDVTLRPRIDIALSFIKYAYIFTPITLVRLMHAQVVSGCLLPLNDQQPGLDKTLMLRSPQEMGDTERSAFAFNLALDVSSALNVDVKRVRVQLLGRNDQLLSHTQLHTMALPSVGDSDDEVSNPNRGRAMRAQAATMVSGAKITVVSPTESGEQSAAAVAQSLNEQMALSDSALSQGVATSKFAPPVTYKWSSLAWSACSCTTRSQTATNVAVCTGSDGSTTTTLALCGPQPAVKQTCTPSGCDTSDDDGAHSSTGGEASSTGGDTGSNGKIGGGPDGGDGDGVGGGDSDSSSGVPILWISVGVGGGVVVLGVAALLAYFCYFKPRRLQSAASPKIASGSTVPVVPSFVPPHPPQQASKPRKHKPRSSGHSAQVAAVYPGGAMAGAGVQMTSVGVAPSTLEPPPSHWAVRVPGGADPAAIKAMEAQMAMQPQQLDVQLQQV